MKVLACYIFLLILTACSGMKKQQINKTTELSTVFDKQGHRGCRGIMPENTIAAMRQALDLGVNTLEMDIVFTRDQQAILSHEPFFNHEITTRPGGSFVSEQEEKNLNIYGMTYDEVRTYDVGMKPHPRFPAQAKIPAVKPLLADVFDSVDQYIAKSKRPLPYFNIETKTDPATDNVFHPAPEQFVDQLMKIIYDKKVEDRVIIQSFDFRTLRYLHRKYPDIKTAALIEDFDERGIRDQLKSLGFIPSIYSPELKLVTAELVRHCHEQGIKIIPWTVNDKATIDRLRDLGVDGIITDFPDLFNQ